jgi:hypothetical protein
MTSKPKDLDPATELQEDDDEASLPETELEKGDSAETLAAGTYAAGRAAIARHAKLAPNRPGVYRMIDAKATCSMSARPRASRSASSPIRGRPGTTAASCA